MSSKLSMLNQRRSRLLTIFLANGVFISCEGKEALGMWFSTMQAKKAIISDAILLEKGKEFAERLQCKDFMASSGWLSRFKARHGNSLKALHCEAASVNSSSVSSSCSELQAITASYAQEGIYNMDETGLFYRMPPGKTLAHSPRQGTKQYKA